MKNIPSHLTNTQIINTGAYYTPFDMVTLAYAQMNRYINDKYVLLDNAAGYGAFINTVEAKRFIAADVDIEAIEFMRKNYASTGRVEIYHLDGLSQNSREKYGIETNEKLIIVGNIPFGDRTSFSKHKKKKGIVGDDWVYKNKDLGIAFLKSYLDLGPEYICILHPTSYITKSFHIKQLSSFFDQYGIIETTTVRSDSFANLKKSIFPISLTLFKKGSKKMPPVKKIKYINKGKTFHTKPLKKTVQFRDVIPKYSKSSKRDGEDPVDTFYTFRDFGFLRRNRGFLSLTDKYQDQSVHVHKDNLKYFSLLSSIKNRLTKDHFYLYNHEPFFFEGTRKNIYNEAIKEYNENEYKSKIIDKYFKELMINGENK